MPPEHIVASDAAGSAGMLAVDISDPTLPRVMDAPAGGGSAFRVLADGDLVIVRDAYKIRILDGSTPALLPLGEWPDPAGLGVAAQDSLLILGGNDHLVILSIADPSAPTILSDTQMDINGMELGIAGNVLYDLRAAELVLVDISDPRHPVRRGVYSRDGDIFGFLAPADGYAIISSDFAGLEVVDTSDPARPVLAGTYQTLSAVVDVAVLDDYLVAATGSGLLVLRISFPYAHRR